MLNEFFSCSAPRRRTLDLERVTKRHFGGTPKQQTPPPPIPPVTSTNAEVQQASRQEKLDAARRKGTSSTILAGGNLGTPGNSVTPFGGKTLLGGGA